jgi:vitamin K-dependent gamma-carboxylase-like protein
VLSLDQVVDPRPLGLARIVIGLAALVALAQAWAVMVAASGPRLDLPISSALPELTPQRAGLLVVPGLVAAVLLTLGLFSRVAALAVAASVGAVFAWEQQTYSSHSMLIGWLAVWLAFARPDAAWSWRARERGRAQVRLRDQLPLMTQLSVCYLFAAVAKLNPGFLSGDELRSTTSVAAPGAFFTVAAVGTVLVELTLACLLWSSRAQPLVMTAGAALHLGIPLSMSSNWVSLSLFSLVCLALYPLFWSLRSRRPGGEAGPSLRRPAARAPRTWGAPQGAVAAQNPERL